MCVKIICTKEEYAAVLKACVHAAILEFCEGCPLKWLHGEDCPGVDKTVDLEIVEAEMGGGLDG